MDLLEKHFDTAFAAPDGMKKLRELILIMAMQGKLVAHDKKDQTVRELLEEIKAPNLLPEIKLQEVPYQLPKGWKWARLNDFGIWKAGSTPSRTNSSYYGGGIPWVKSGEVKQGRISVTDETITQEALDNCPLALNPIGSVLVAMYGANIGDVGILEIQATTNQAVCACTPYSWIDNIFLHHLLISLKQNFIAKGAGAAQPNISKVKIIQTLAPLPPLAEQRRIVAKIGQLMARCDELEKLRAERQQKRRIVHTAALNRLLMGTQNHDFSTAWHFITQHFDELYSVKENVGELRNAILQLAVMGKLVTQDPNDPPVSELLKEIEAEKQRLVTEKKIKTRKPLPDIKPEEVPYKLPEGWEWVRLGFIAEFINGDRGKNYPNKDEYVSEGIPWINTGHIEPNGTLTESEMNFITRDKFNSLRGGKIQLGDLVYCLRGATFGKTAIVDPYDEGAIASSLMIIRPISGLSKEFIYRYLVSPTGRSQIFLFDNGSAQPNLSANSVRLYVFPLPPPAEQRRIVAKIDQLMALCDELEQNINASTGKQTALLNALMAQA